MASARCARSTQYYVASIARSRELKFDFQPLPPERSAGGVRLFQSTRPLFRTRPPCCTDASQDNADRVLKLASRFLRSLTPGRERGRGDVRFALASDTHRRAERGLGPRRVRLGPGRAPARAEACADAAGRRAGSTLPHLGRAPRRAYGMPQGGFAGPARVEWVKPRVDAGAWRSLQKPRMLATYEIRRWVPGERWCGYLSAAVVMGMRADGEITYARVPSRQRWMAALSPRGPAARRNRPCRKKGYQPALISRYSRARRNPVSRKSRDISQRSAALTEGWTEWNGLSTVVGVAE